MTSHPPLTSALELLVSRPVSPSRCNSSDGEHTDADGLGLSEQARAQKEGRAALVVPRLSMYIYTQIQRLQATLHETELALRRERDRACMLEQEVKRLLRDKPVSRSPSAQDLNPLSEPGDEGGLAVVCDVCHSSSVQHLCTSTCTHHAPSCLSRVCHV